MSTEQKIVNIWKRLNGTLYEKAVQMVKLLGFNYIKIDKRSEKERDGWSNGVYIAFPRIYDKTDLFIVFHEIGHCFLHSFDDQSANEYRKNSEVYNKEEKEADEFAYNCMRKLYGNTKKIQSLYNIHLRL